MKGVPLAMSLTAMPRLGIRVRQSLQLRIVDIDYEVDFCVYWYMLLSFIGVQPIYVEI